MIPTYQLQREFGSEIRARGKTYAGRGRVHSIEMRNNAIEAVVRGSDDYGVTIDVKVTGDGWVLRPECPCPYGMDHDGRCKHVWAVLLVAQARGFGALGPAPARVRLASAFDEADDEPVEPVQVLARVGSNGVVTRASSAELIAELRRRVAEKERRKKEEEALRKKKEEEQTPAWVKLIKQSPASCYRQPDPQPAPAGELAYVVDVGRSRVAGVLKVAVHARENDGNRRRKQKRVTIGAGQVAALPDPKDRVICGMLVGTATPDEFSYGYVSSQSDRASSIWSVGWRMLPVLMPLLMESGRLYWCERKNYELRPLKWDPDAVWERVLEIEPQGDRGGVLCCGVKRVGNQPQGKPLLMIDGNPGAVLCDGVLSPLLTHGCTHVARWIDEIRPHGVKREHAALLVKELAASGVTMPVAWPSGWGVNEVQGTAPAPRLTLRARGKASAPTPADTTSMELEFDYAGKLARHEEHALYVVPEGTKPGAGIELIRRDAVRERGFARRLEQLGARQDAYARNPLELFAPTKKIPSIVTTLLKEGWDVRGDKTLYRRPGDIKIDVVSGIDWFDVHGTVSFDGGGSAGIADLLEALKRGEQFVTLGDGSLGMLPEEWLEKHGGWLRLGKAGADDKGSVRFAKAQLGIIDALLAEMPEATCDAQVAAARERLARFEGVAARREPASFRGELRPYQREGLGWLRFLEDFGFGGILADDMGLGKTVQLLAHLAELKERGERGAWLVVAPKSLVFNWAREAERFAPKLKVLEHTGLERRGRKGFGSADLVLTTYGTMRRDAEVLAAAEWTGMVLDEAQAIKNGDSQSAKAARLVGARAPRRLALTGTPVENQLGDLWSIMEFLNPGMLGGAVAFREALGAGADGAGADLRVLRRAMRPFILRRTKERVAPELPARSEQTITCELGSAQRKLYDGVLAHYKQQLLGAGGVVERQGMGRSRMHVLEALLRLRQAACHPRLLEVKPEGRAKKNGKAAARRASPPNGTSENAESAKLEALMDMLTEMAAEGHRALVFSQFTSLLALLRERLNEQGVEHEYLDGQTTAKERQASIDRFQSDAGARVFLISLKAGGVGLNLTAADYVFLLDPWWNPAVEAQAIDRAHRIGQTKKVIAYRLIARGTVEEKIQELQASKRELAAAIVGDDAGEREGPLSSLTREELGWLLGA